MNKIKGIPFSKNPGKIRAEDGREIEVMSHSEL